MQNWTDEEWRERLQAYLGERQKKVPQYSISAFARDLGVENSLMYRILNGERAISLNVRIRLEEFFKDRVEDKSTHESDV